MEGQTGVQNERAVVSDKYDDDRVAREDLDAPDIESTGQLMIRFKYANNNVKVFYGSASLYGKVSKTQWMIVTAAHNFTKKDEDGEDTIQYLDGVFALHRKNEEEMLAKFNVVEYIIYDKFDCDDEEYWLKGTDIALAIVEIEQPISEENYKKIKSTFTSPGYLPES